MGRRRRTGCNEDMFRKCEMGGLKGWYTKRKEETQKYKTDTHPTAPTAALGQTTSLRPSPRPCPRRHAVHTERRGGRVKEPGEQSRVRGEKAGVGGEKAGLRVGSGE
jgi:hypothetical protein